MDAIRILTKHVFSISETRHKELGGIGAPVRAWLTPKSMKAHVRDTPSGLV